jgi:hypothetical protein
VELWATRWRRPSAAANPQGFCWPAPPRLTHFVTRAAADALVYYNKLDELTLPKPLRMLLLTIFELSFFRGQILVEQP